MAAAAAAGGEEAKGAAVAAMRALVLGATGETGRCLIKQLAASPRCERVTAVVRRALKDEEVAARWRLSDAEKAKVRQAVVDYEKLDEFREVFQDQTDVFCCLGTTRAKAGSAEAFRRVDYDYVLHSARLAKAAGTRHFSLLTSQGANADAWFLYPQVKGQVENECKKMGFERLSIFRPGLLLTERQETRAVEYLAQRLWPNWMLPESAKATATDNVARAMALNAERTPLGAVELYDNAAIRQLHVGREGVADDKNARGMCVSK